MRCLCEDRACNFAALFITNINNRQNDQTTLIFSFFLFSITVSANNDDGIGTIKGKVTTSDNQPAATVTVSIKDTRRNFLTAEDGSFIFKNMAAGNYEMQVSMVGYETTTQHVTVEQGKTAEVFIQLQLSNKQLQEVIIKAGTRGYKVGNLSTSLRLQTPLLETPQNIQIVTNKNLADQQVISMSDGVIRNVSGVTRAEHWGDMYANISARGSQIQAFRNGFNVVNSFWGPLTEDMSFVENIEFVKGPAGFMLSSGDPSGLYNVVTKKPTGQTKGEATLTLGSYDLFRTTLDLDGKLSKDGKLLYRLNLSAQNKGSFRANEYNDRYAVAPVISYQVDDKTKLTLEYNYQRANMSDVGSFYVFSPDGYATRPVEFTSLISGSPGTKMNDHSVYFTLQHDLSKEWKFTAQVAKFVYDQVGVSSWPSVINADGTYIRNIGIWDAHSDMNMAQAFLNGDVSTGKVRHRILAGLDIAKKSYIADWGQSHDLDTESAPFDPNNPNTGIPENGFPVFDRETPLAQRAQAAGGLQNMRYTSLYLQDELGFFDNKFRLTLAGRYTDLQQAAWGAAADKAKHVTPRIGLSASLDKYTAVYALYDQAFIPQTGKMADGKKVQPVTGNNMEIGIKKDWFGGKWNTTLAVYRILKNNELTADPFSAPTSGLSIELGQKRSQGVEFDLRGNLAKGLNLVANYAYTDSKVSKVSAGVTGIKVGDLVPGFAKHTTNLWLTYKASQGALKNFGLSAGFTYLAGRATYYESAPDPNKNLNDYFRLDAGLFWEKDKIRISANVFNVLDKYLYTGSYESWTSNVPVYDWQTEALRNARFSVSYRF
ncbi:MAG: TonB-dependent receptor [Ferruginibacter sp.]